MTEWTLYRDSREWVGPFTVTDRGEPVTGWEIAVYRVGETIPDTAWQAPTELDGGLGILVGPGSEVGALAPGPNWRVAVRYTATPEAVVEPDAATIRIT